MEQQKTNIPTIEYNGLRFNTNLFELRDFLNNCSGFMDINEQSFEIMIQSISDQLIDNAEPEITIGELRPQLRFLREVNFFLKGLISSRDDV